MRKGCSRNGLSLKYGGSKLGSLGPLCIVLIEAGDEGPRSAGGDEAASWLGEVGDGWKRLDIPEATIPG